MVQVMPGCDEQSLARLENSVQGLMSVTDMLKQGMDGQEIIKYVMLGFDVEILGAAEVGYACDCGRERMERAIVSLGKKEIQDIIDEQGQAEIVCHFCNRAYTFGREELKAMLAKAVRR